MNYIQYMKTPFQPIVSIPTQEQLIEQRKKEAWELAKKENNIITETDRLNAEIEANIKNATTPRRLKGLKLAKNAINFGLGAGAFVGTTMAYPYFAAAGPGGLAAAGGLQGTALGMMGDALENQYDFNAGLTTGSAIKDAMLGATGEVVLGPMIGKGISWVGNKTAPVWNAARHYAAGLYNTTNYSSLGNRLAHPIESLRFAKINTKLSDLVRRAYPEETAKLMLEEASPLFKTVRYYNKGTSGPLYIGGTDIPLLIEGLRNTPTTTVKMWDRAHEYGHLFDDALRRLDTGMARGSFGLSKEGISFVPKNYTYGPNVGINTPRGQMEFMADNIASSLYPEPKHVGMLNGEVAPYLERLALAAQVPFSSMYVLNGGTHVPYFLPEYKNFGRFIPASTRRGSLGKGASIDDYVPVKPVGPSMVDVSKAFARSVSDAKAVATEEAVVNLLVHNNKLAERIYGSSQGKSSYSIPEYITYRIMPREELARIKQGSSNNVGLDWMHVGGLWDPVSKELIASTSKGMMSPTTPYHEGLHAIRYGVTADPRLTQLKISKIIDPIKAQTAKNGNYYFSNIEAPVHYLSLGKLWGVPIGAPYPGRATVEELIFKNGIGGTPWFTKLLTDRDYKRFWDAITGVYFKSGGKLNYLNLMENGKLVQ